MSKALILKSSPRLHDKVEAEKILRGILYQIERKNLSILSLDVYASIHYCEILLSELDMTKEITVLDEIEPVITRLLKSTENRRSYMWLAEVKLLQAKLALIKMNLDEARKLLIEAQVIADSHDLHLLAGEISREHDHLLEELKLWESFKKTQASVSERLKLASIDGILERL